MNRFETIKEALIKLYEDEAELEGEVSHSLNTLYWVCKLSMKPSEYLRVAALAHDIDRVIKPRVIQTEGESYDDYKRRHSERSVKLISDFASKFGYTGSEIGKISALVLLHEFGGSEEADILQDADSISYFDNNLEIYFKRSGYEKTAMKVKWMFERCSKRAQNVIKTLPMYLKFQNVKS